MNYILSNQDMVLTQITQLENAITQTEVRPLSSSVTKEMQRFHWLSNRACSGKQRIGQRAALSLREGDHGVADRAAGDAGPGSGELTTETGRRLVQSGGRETQSAGARRPDGFYSRAP